MKQNLQSFKNCDFSNIDISKKNLCLIHIRISSNIDRKIIISSKD